MGFNVHAFCRDQIRRVRRGQHVDEKLARWAEAGCLTRTVRRQDNPPRHRGSPRRGGYAGFVTAWAARQIKASSYRSSGSEPASPGAVVW